MRCRPSGSRRASSASPSGWKTPRISGPISTARSSPRAEVSVSSSNREAKMKRLLLLAGLAAIAFTGPALADTNLKLVEVITSPQRTEFLKGQIDKFEAANPGIHVEIISLPWGEAFEKFLTMVQAGETPDIAE